MTSYKTMQNNRNSSISSSNNNNNIISCDKMGKTIGHTIVGCLSLSESTYLRRHSQLTKIIHQQCAIECKLLDRNAPPYCRYRPEGVLEWADIIWYWDRFIFTDRMADFNIPDTVLIDRLNKTAFVLDNSSSLDP